MKRSHTRLIGHPEYQLGFGHVGPFSAGLSIFESTERGHSRRRSSNYW